MKTTPIFIIGLLLCVFNVRAQSDIAVFGKIVDSQTQKPIPFANIVFSKNNEVKAGTISEPKEGSFQIDGLAPGIYKMKVTFVGFIDFSTEVILGELNKHYDLGKISLKPNTNELTEIHLKGKKNSLSNSLDKKTYTIDQLIAQTGGSVMDIMKTMPSISFDQEGKVVLRGSDKVIVLIDGKQSSLTGFGNQKGLDNIPANNIEKIEIINNPSAKYDANGMAGIINIVYKKNRAEGLHGSLGFNYGLGALSKAIQDLPSQLGSYSMTPKYIPNLSLNFKKDKINSFIQGEVLAQEKLPNNEFTTRFYDSGVTIASQVPENRNQTRYIVKGGIDYKISEQDQLSFSGILDWESHNDLAQVPYIDTDTNIRNRYIEWDEKEITGYLNYVLSYKHQFKQKGHELHAQLLYAKGWEDETYSITDSSAVRTNGKDITSVLGTEYTSSFNIDYTKPLKTGRIESGLKLQNRNLPVSYEQIRGQNSILYSGLGNWSKWKETIYAGYLNWVHEKSNYAIEAGLRTEHAFVGYEMDEENIYYNSNDKYDYLKLFPNLRLTYKLNTKNKISVFYNIRVDRPGEPQLRMYSKSDDHELVKVGNPYLRPQFTKSIEVGYSTRWHKGSLYLSLYNKYIQDPFMRVYTTDDSRPEYNIILKSYANTGSAYNSGFEVVFDQKIGSFYQLSANFNYYQNQINAYEGDLLFPYRHTFTLEKSSVDTWDAKMINTFDLAQYFQIQLTATYMAPKNIAQGKQLSRSSVDFGLKKKFQKGKLETTIAITDMFNQFGLEQEIYGNGFKALYQNFYETQTIRLGLTYKF